MNAATEWIPVGALGDAFLPDNNCLVTVDELAGREVKLCFDNGWVIDHRFGANGELQWQMLAGESDSRGGNEHYTATRPRPGIYFVDFIKSGERATSVSLVLDFNRGTFVGVVGQLPVEEEAMTPFIQRIAQGKPLSSVQPTFVRGTLDRPVVEAELPAPTRELLGKRVEYTYSPHERYEHIYLNEQLYSWRCLAGSEKGLADTDACNYFKVADDLYLFVWWEKIVPTLGVVVLDFQAKKTSGKIMGYEQNDFGAVRNFGVGAYVRLLCEIPAE